MVDTAVRYFLNWVARFTWDSNPDLYHDMHDPQARVLPLTPPWRQETTVAAAWPLTRAAWTLTVAAWILTVATWTLTVAEWTLTVGPYRLTLLWNTGQHLLCQRFVSVFGTIYFVMRQ